MAKAKKRLENSTALKFMFVGQTDKKNNHIRVTQLNSNKKISLGFPDDITVFQFIENLLDSIECIESYQLIIDNTQTNYYLFSINVSGKSFPDLISFFKEYKL